MPQKHIPIELVLSLFKKFGATEAARQLGVNERNIYSRVAKARKSASILPPTKQGKGVEHSQRQELRVDNGCVVVGSDFHIWPGHESTCLRAFKFLCKELKPKAVILNGDVLDFPKISRHAPIMWEDSPDPQEEVECAQDHLHDIEQACGRAAKIWTLGNHDCLDTETQCLTRRGWLSYQDLRQDDIVLSIEKGSSAVWSRIDEIVSFPYHGELVRIDKTRMSMAVTPNHRVLLSRMNWRSRAYDIAEYRNADDLPSSFNMPVAGNTASAGSDLSDDEIALAGWILTDGCFDKYNISIYQSKPSGINEIRGILDRLGVTYSVYERQRTKTAICERELLKTPLPSTQFFISAESAKIIRKWLPKKGSLPVWAFDLTERQFGILLDALVAGDGVWDGADPSGKTCCVIYGTEGILSSIQSIAVCHGWRARLAMDNRGDYRLCLARAPKLRIESGDIFREQYSGIVWCLRVPHGNFMVRRKGAAFFTGNSRFESRIADVAPQYKRIKGVHLKDHFPMWTPAWSAWINNDVVVKHRFKSGIHAPHNNTMWAGKTMVTGHLHSQKVMPITDYNGTRYGIDTGCVADPYHKAFIDYTEDSPVNWISGFAVLKFKDGRLMLPELVKKWDDNSVEFRGEIIKV